jgi:hypothetical protein
MLRSVHNHVVFTIYCGFLFGLSAALMTQSVPGLQNGSQPSLYLPYPRNYSATESIKQCTKLNMTSMCLSNYFRIPRLLFVCCICVFTFPYTKIFVQITGGIGSRFASCGPRLAAENIASDFVIPLSVPL